MEVEQQEDIQKTASILQVVSTVNESIQDSIKTDWFCNRCNNFLQRKKIPAVSQFNKIKVVDIPSVLMGKNTLEQRLISKATVFMKMVILPRVLSEGK